MFILSDQVKARIREFLPEFKKWSETREIKDFLKERDDRIRTFGELLSVANIDQLTEPDFRQIISSLWAYIGWTNKDYVADRILEKTDFDTLRSELKNLLYGDGPLASRYDRFFERVKGIGPAGVTEIIAFVHPKKYCIWNEKSRRALEILGLGGDLPTKKYKISGSEYERVNEALKSISQVIDPKAEPDLFLVDLFIFYLTTRESVGAPVEVMEAEDYDFDHDEIVDKLVEIGNGLGFEADSEQQVAKGARVDVVWRVKIANLGVVTYVFEVQKGGSIDSLILNLQRARNNPTVQKAVVVANAKDIRRVKEEVEPLGEDFKKSLAYLEVKDVKRASNLLAELNSIISKLELVKGF